MAKATSSQPASTFPKAYLRLDPDIDMTHPDVASFVKLLCAANRQPRRGHFKDFRLIENALGRGPARRLKDRGDIVQEQAGTWHVQGWELWQEGDITVGERMRALRERRRRNGTVTPAVTAPAQEGGETGDPTVTPTVTGTVTDASPGCIARLAPFSPPSDSPPISPEASGARRQASDAAVAANNTTTPPPPASGERAAAEDYVPVEVLKCPDCQRVAVIRQRAEHGTGWVCFKRQGGCGMVFDVGTKQLLDQLPTQQLEAVRRSVERMTGHSPAAIKAAPDLALEAGRRRIAAQVEQAQTEPAGKVWDQVLALVQAGLNPHTFATWFRPTVCHGMLRDAEGVRLVVEVPRQEFGEWIGRNWWRQVDAAMRQLGREDLRVYMVAPSDGAGWTLGPSLAEAIAQREQAAG
jgi:DnaA-like protein